MNSGLQQEKEKSLSENALENMKNFYKDNEALCQQAYSYFQGYQNNIRHFVAEPLFVPIDEFKSLLRATIILVLTVNPIEKAVFLRWLSEKQAAPLSCFMVEDLACVIYHLDSNRTVIHANPDKTGENETRIILNKLSRIFKPTYLLMLGICYGLDMKKYSIGSVFISNRLITFRINFRDELHSDETIFEAEDEYNLQPDFSFTKKIQQTMSYTVVRNILTTEESPKIVKSEIGSFLSCNSLVSSRKVKQAVMEQHNFGRIKPLGGEMEGAGVLKSNMVEKDGFSHWLIVKSICDWGEKKNLLDEDAQKSDEIKDSLQAFAMTNTCSAFEKIEGVLRR